MKQQKQTVTRVKKVTKKSSIIKMSILGFLLIIGILLSTISFDLPWNNGIERYNSFASSIELGSDLGSGMFAVFKADADESDKDRDIDNRMIATRDKLETFVVARYTQATVTRQGVDRIRIEVPAASDPKIVLETIGSSATVSFKISEEEYLRGEHIERVTPLSNYNGAPAVEIRLNSSGTSIFKEVTEQHNGETLVVEVTPKGGTSQPINITINQTITNGIMVISGGGTIEAATSLAAMLISGSLDMPLSKVEISKMAPTLGYNVLFYLTIAASIAILAILALMIVRYKLLGAMAAFAILIFTVLTLFGLAVVPWVQLTLAGVVAILIGLGIALDATIVIIEKIREEYRFGKSLNASRASGFHRGFMAMLDTHIVMLVASIVILSLVPGVFKGFGLVLLITTLLSMFCSVFIFGKLIKWIGAIVGDKNAQKLGIKRDINITVNEETGEITHLTTKTTISQPQPQV